MSGLTNASNNLVAITQRQRDVHILAAKRGHLDAGAWLKILKFCVNLSGETGTAVVLRKVPGIHAAKLAASSESCQIADPDLCNLDDDAFPETWVDPHAVIALAHDPPSNRLARKLRRFNRNGLTLEMESIDTLASRGGLTSFLHGLNLRPEVLDAYVGMTSLVESLGSNSGVFGWSFSDGDNAGHGLYLCHELEAGRAGIYCALTSRVHPGATEWMDVKVLSSLADVGYKRVDFGGSESRGVYRYVKKFQPHTLFDSVSLLITSGRTTENLGRVPSGE